MALSPGPVLVRDALELWCAAGASGALRVLEAPGGVIHLVGGRIAYAESPVTTSLERQLAATGRVSTEAWRAAAATGRAQARIGDELIEAALVSRLELEALAEIAIHDAAFFLLDLVAMARFEPGARHPLGHRRLLDLRAVCQEAERRRRLLADAWPDQAIDTAAVLPVSRLTGQVVALTALQWEVVANANRRRSPIDLARLLGRDTFGVLLEVRRMARAGLVEAGRQGGSAASESVAAARAAAAVAQQTEPVRRGPARSGKRKAAVAEAPTTLDRRTIPQQRRPVPVEQIAPHASDEHRLSDQVLTRLIAGLTAL
ncbi:hypothetical protein F4553_006195 [Allocatelliglobosispora scoriae]|uniref:DUF4388 domain-containing protein n=1 Tax=Allocatelliglobosispora scoriae TaxID=643052 RepID=A0A841C1L4_9ACTN|nr:hypothetical protein [Allocatelliglobosispora scoriae]MBB5872761.1 hypothetical protein [Allocatelliglobosispora scoriae]